MKRMGTYCKAYHLSRFKHFPGWSEKCHLDLMSHDSADARDNKAHLYLHEDYTVTGGVFLSENVVYDEVTPDWISFCNDVLHFLPLQRDERAAPATESN